MAIADLGLLLLQLALYFMVMATLFGLRHRYGIGIFFCALGAMHFLETYLAATFYVAVPPGIVVSPGSTILFSGKIMLLLLVYIREDAVAVRQPIYGLFMGNILTIGLVALLRANVIVPTAGPAPDFLFMDQMGTLMIWGTLLLLADGILIILVYEQLGRWYRGSMLARLAASGVIVLTFDQLMFWPVLHLVAEVPVDTFLGGWVAKATTACICAVLVTAYLRYFEPRVFDGFAHPRLLDVFDALTYRQRYEELLQRTGRDGLTGVSDRGQMESEAENMIMGSIKRGMPVSVLLIDIDDFKRVNDEFGHLVGDAVLRSLAQMLTHSLRDSDRIYRFGGDEFVVVSNNLAADGARSLADRLHWQTATLRNPDLREPLTISIGLATSPQDGTNFISLLSAADKRLYSAKTTGRNRVVGTDGEPGDDAAGLVRQT
ncbi:diguanylate cyclase [Microbaculum marinum]|uniref:diguanylate cyclase n=1 Tax=Microbaculum marinum TaxID=1764581 RepID=A0AAW9RVH8_9HYPH